MKFQELLEELKRLKLSKNEYAIVGSGALAVRGIRESDDLDIIVTKEVFKRLLKKYPQDVRKHKYGCLMIGNIEVGDKWLGEDSEVKKIIDNAEDINGFSFAPLSFIIEWKKKIGREKDKKDLELIKKYLSMSKNG